MKNCLYLFLLAPLLLCGCSASSSDTPPVITHTVSVEVRGMVCPNQDWPRVERALKAEPGTGAVTLKEQPDFKEPADGVSAGFLIKDPVVFVDVGDEFDYDHAKASLAAIDFKSVSIAKLQTNL